MRPWLSLSLVLLASCECGTTRWQTSGDARVADASRDPDGSAGLDTSRPLPDAEPPGPYCIENWPAPVAATPRPSLAQTPRLLWRRTAPAFGFGGGEVVLTADRLAFVDGNRLVMYDHAGNLIANLIDAGAHMGNGPVADTAGNIYYSTSMVYSVRPDGTTRWVSPLGPNIGWASETTMTSGMLLSPEGILYFTATDGGLYALRASDGGQVWGRYVGIFAGAALHVGPGVGDTFYVQSKTADPGKVPYRAATGQAGPMVRVAGNIVSVGAATFDALLAGRYENVGGRLCGRGYALDKCGQLLWSLPNDNGSWGVDLTLFGDKLLVFGGDQGQDTYIYSAAGERLLGPARLRGFPMTLGADGTIYNRECNGSDDRTADMTIIAYSPDLTELWSLPVGPPCSHSLALADDGVLYAVADGTTATEVIAVQTASPGVASTSYPTHDFNNRRTGWLAP